VNHESHELHEVELLSVASSLRVRELRPELEERKVARAVIDRVFVLFVDFVVHSEI
jgi:hypothetical protein